MAHHSVTHPPAVIFSGITKVFEWYLFKLYWCKMVVGNRERDVIIIRSK